MNLYDDRLDTPQGSVPLTGLTAEVTSGGQIARTKSVAATILFGVAGLAATRKIDERELFLTVVGNGLGLAIGLHPDRVGSARAFAATLEAMAGAKADGRHSAPRKTSSVADELEKLAGLLDGGVLTDKEFQQQKARLLA